MLSVGRATLRAMIALPKAGATAKAAPSTAVKRINPCHRRRLELTSRIIGGTRDGLNAKHSLWAGLVGIKGDGEELRGHDVSHGVDVQEVHGKDDGAVDGDLAACAS